MAPGRIFLLNIDWFAIRKALSGVTQRNL